jgi:hypothetical protein
MSEGGKFAAAGVQFACRHPENYLEVINEIKTAYC